jgi:hypothetical protein
MVITTLTLMMATEDIKETLDYRSTLTQLISPERFNARRQLLNA